jgi:carbonic anhydrase/acetyltransferase-like protein (isoleucine patch superfamily)
MLNFALLKTLIEGLSLESQTPTLTLITPIAPTSELEVPYTPGYVSVTLDEVPTVDFTAEDGETIVFGSPVSAGVEIRVFAQKAAFITVLKLIETAGVYDFGEGEVPAYQYVNPDLSLGGWVSQTAYVDRTSYISADSTVAGVARILGTCTITESSIADMATVINSTVLQSSVSGNSRVENSAIIRADIQDSVLVRNTAVTDSQIVDGAVLLGGNITVDYANISDWALLTGEVVVNGESDENRATVSHAALMTGSTLMDGKVTLEHSAELRQGATLISEPGYEIVVSGVSMIDGSARVRGDSVITDNVKLSGGVLVTNSEIEDEVRIDMFATVEDSQLGGQTIVTQTARVTGVVIPNEDPTVQYYPTDPQSPYNEIRGSMIVPSSPAGPGQGPNQGSIDGPPSEFDD